MCRPLVTHLTRLDETFHHLPRVLENKKRGNREISEFFNKAI
jgi:hypothetical protein